MNAPFNPSRDLHRLALDIISGEMVRPYGIGGHYEVADWRSAAEGALDVLPTDEPDFSELAEMIDHEEKLEAFREWQGDFASREWVDLDDWADQYWPSAAVLVPAMGRVA